MTHINNRIDYIEFSMLKGEETKVFYSELFGWEFTDWWEEYMSFSGAGIDGWFTKVESVPRWGPLIILYSDSLEDTFELVGKTGTEITTPIFEFPWGRRFQFLDPNGNELAVWSDKKC
jgi:predicted enzyme related to lactoylglutathione lyase